MSRQYLFWAFMIVAGPYIGYLVVDLISRLVWP
jgi:hypothetical protein